MHVVTAGDSATEGNVPDTKLREQINVLNSSFAGTEFSFRLAGVDRTMRPDWHKAERGSTEENQMKHTLRRGRVSELNVYLTDSKDYLGWATFPWDFASNPDNDGVVLNWAALPGGWMHGYTQGKVLVSEVGNWLGLFDVFEGGCTSPGDHVEDTPPTAAPMQGCPEGRDTCPLPGTDPIHNYMNTTYDTCRNQFTPGQIKRMHLTARQYRGVG
ncbi:zinc metalloprotease [Nonomuraea insulae]|uniref:Zinc metalloprotease n=1 Tax=Nonomuraea insulae TaxID=1616787 RepID=A0ABW1CUF4_9ACTN